MKVLIEINCELKSELFAHLSVIRQQLKHETRGIGDFETIPREIEVSDDNCYGSHIAKIEIED